MQQDSVVSPRPCRRAALILLSAAAAGFACAGQARAQPASAPTELVVAALGGSLGRSIAEVFEPFEKQYNVSIRWDAEGSSVENVARAVATKAHPAFDLVFGDMTTQDAGSAQGVWAQIDESVVTNYRNQMPQATVATHDTVFFGFVATGMFYDSKVFEQNGWKPPTHWDDLLRKEFCGRVGINHPNVSYGVQTLIMLGGGNPANTGAGIAKLAAYKDCITVLEPTAAKLEEKIALGEYMIGVEGSVRIVPMTRKGLPVRFVVPDEGPAMYASGVSPVKNAPHAALDQQFLNWILRPDVQLQLMEKAYYGPTNATVEVPKDYAQLGVPTAEVVKRSVFIPGQTITENRRNWTRQLDRAMEK